MSNETGKSLGERIKEDIKKRKLNGSAIAREMNVSRQVINQIDLRKTFDIEFLQKLKNATGLDYTNYVFNPKRNAYEPIDQVQLIAKDPEGTYEKEQGITVEIKVTATYKTFGLHFAELLEILKKETSRLGFKVE